MPNIVFANPKGGAGKSTAALLLSIELAAELKVCVVDADIRRRIAKWHAGGGAPENMLVIGNADEDNIIDKMDEAASKAPFTVVDLEGTASKLVLLAISQADLVIIPLQDSAPDAEEAAAVIKVIRQQERLSGRSVPFCILPTRMPAAYRSRMMTHILSELEPTGARVLKNELVERQAFKAIWLYDATLDNLPSGEVSRVDVAKDNAHRYAAEVVDVLKELKAKAKEGTK